MKELYENPEVRALEQDITQTANKLGDTSKEVGEKVVKLLDQLEQVFIPKSKTAEEYSYYLDVRRMYLVYERNTLHRIRPFVNITPSYMKEKK